MELKSESHASAASSPVPKAELNEVTKWKSRSVCVPYPRRTVSNPLPEISCLACNFSEGILIIEDKRLKN
jgi:hypothetical protein